MRILNTPNRITLLRIILIPLFVFFMLDKSGYTDYIASFIFIMLSLSDIIDGYFARKKGQVTPMGAIMDPIADKILISSALAILYFRGVSGWIVLPIIMRETVITSLRLYLSAKGITIDVSRLGKLKAALQMLAITMAIMNAGYFDIMLWIAMIITVLSGIDYLIKVKKITNNDVVTVPNLITLMRFVLIPFFITSFIESKTTMAIVAFAFITAADKLDGLSARVMKQVTELGVGFDSFTDWTFIILSFFSFIFKGKMSILWAVFMIICGGASMLAKIRCARKEKAIPVTTISKLATGFIYATLFAILVNFEYVEFMFPIMAILSFVSLVTYLLKAYASTNKSVTLK